MHNLLKTGLCFFLLIIATTVATTTVAETAAKPEPEQAQAESEPKQYYIVEVILFRHLNEQGKLDEFWYHPDLMDNSGDFMAESSFQNATQEQRSEPITDDIPALAEYDLSNRRFLPLRNGIAALSSSNYKLADSAAHLRYSPDFQLLAHFGWTQRSLSKQAALPIFI